MKCLVILLFIAYLSVYSAHNIPLNIEEFKAVDPGDQIVYLEAHSVDNVKDKKNYYIGSRIPGDRLVFFFFNNYNWVTPENIVIQTTYPIMGTESLINYISINVTQSSDIGKVYITRGGIGSRFVTFFNEGSNATYFNYVTEIYGTG